MLAQKTKKTSQRSATVTVVHCQAVPDGTSDQDIIYLKQDEKGILILANGKSSPTLKSLNYFFLRKFGFLS